MRVTVSKLKYDYNFLYLLGLEDEFSATKDAVVHLHVHTIWISPQRDSAHFGGK